MKTLTEQRIELGQNINNAWAIVAANIIASGSAHGEREISAAFRAIYQAVSKESSTVRDEEEARRQERLAALPPINAATNQTISSC